MKLHDDGFDLVAFVYELDADGILIFVEGDKIKSWFYVLEVADKKTYEF